MAWSGHKGTMLAALLKNQNLTTTDSSTKAPAGSRAHVLRVFTHGYGDDFKNHTVHPSWARTD